MAVTLSPTKRPLYSVTLRTVMITQQYAKKNIFKKSLVQPCSITELLQNDEKYTQENHPGVAAPACVNTKELVFASTHDSKMVLTSDNVSFFSGDR